MDRSKQFREAAARENQGRRKTGWRYSAELKRLAVELARDRRQSGITWSQLADELGVSALTLGRWVETISPARFRPVEVVKTPESCEPGPLTVVTPGGLCIEGLAWSQILELTRIFR